MKKIHLGKRSSTPRVKSNKANHIKTPWRILALLLTGLMLSLLVTGTKAATISKINTEDGSADIDFITRSVEFTTDDFVNGSTISDVNISLNFEKVSGTCPTHDGGSPFNREIYAFLTSPSNTQVTLIEDSQNSGDSGAGYTYYSGTEYGGNVTVLFNDSAGVAVGGPAPVSGAFRPVQPLTAFDLEDPLGTWTLTIGDSGAGDPLCFYEFTLTVEADQPPSVDDQTFSVAENSSDGTSVGTVVAMDPDTGDKLTYEITDGNDDDVFAIDPNTGEITVADGSQLDLETPPSSYALTVEVTDSTFLTDTAIITINIDNVNEAPTANDDSYTADEDTALNVSAPGVLDNDTDPDNTDTLSVSDHDATSAEGADVTVNADGSLSYDPTGSTALQALAAGASVVDTFDYTIQDAAALTSTAVVSITVSGIDDAPVAEDDNATTPEETAVTIDVLDNDSDIENDPISVTDVGSPANGTADIVGITVVYTPTIDFVGTDIFTYTITANGATDTANINVNVTNINDAPVANDDSYTADEDNVLDVSAPGVLDNDMDPDDSDTLSVSDHDATSAEGADVTVNADGSISYDPTGSTALQALSAGDSITDTFGYTIQDTALLTSTAVVSITVSGIDDAPVAEDDNATTPEETAVTIDVLDNDSDIENDPISVTGVGTPANGIAAIVGQTVVYTPTIDFVGTDIFTYTITANGATDTANINVNVTDINDGPTEISLDNDNVDENQPIGTLVGTFDTADPDANDSFTYTFTAGAGDGDNGSFTISTDQLLTGEIFNFEADSSYSILVQSADSGGITVTQQFTITINDLNDPPIAVDDTGYATNEDNILTVPADGVLANDTDQDDTLTVNSYASPSTNGASVIVNTDGGFTYDPSAAPPLQALAVGESIVDTFTYDATDGELSATATVSVTVTGVNDEPIANDDTAATTDDTAVTIQVLLNDTDPDTSDVLAIDAITQGASGTVVDNLDGTLTFTPTVGVTGDITFTYTIDDGHSSFDTATVTVTVNPSQYSVFLPVILNNYTHAPDLVVNSVEANSETVEVVVQNQGPAATAGGFWVDFYVDPNPVPNAANQLWPTQSSEGIAWGITESLASGDVLTLTYSTAPGAPNLYYSPADSNFSGTLPSGTPIYAQVDSAHAADANGGVLETHEITGGPYNNISALATASSAPLAATAHWLSFPQNYAVVPLLENND